VRVFADAGTYNADVANTDNVMSAMLASLQAFTVPSEAALTPVSRMLQSTIGSSLAPVHSPGGVSWETLPALVPALNANMHIAAAEKMTAPSNDKHGVRRSSF
jgi:hypothetical protein